MPEIVLPAPGRPYVTVRADHPAGLTDLAHAEMAALFKAHGALLVRGFASDLDRFRAFTDRWCATWVVNEASGRDVLDATHNVQSVNRGTRVFPLHSEISRAPWRPDICFFHCLQPPGTGGETTVCDGTAIVPALSAELREALAARRLVYIRQASPAELIYWLGTAEPNDAQLAAPPAGCPFRYHRRGSHVMSMFSRPALHRPMFTDAPAFANFLLFAREKYDNRNFPIMSDGKPVPDDWVDEIRSVSAALTAKVAWQAHDLLILDNSRFMHGRVEVTDPGERVIASRFGYLNFALANPEEPTDPVWRRESFIPPDADFPRG